MQDTATLIAHILFKNGAILNIGTVLRNLDSCLETASNGAYSLVWDSEEVMVAQFAQTKVILVAAPQIDAGAGFTLTIAVSPKDVDAVADPVLARFHKHLALDLVARFNDPAQSSGVMWQRAAAPISAEAVERIAEAMAERLAELTPTHMPLLSQAGSLETAPLLPASALVLQSSLTLPM